jgi:hypothetical protein
VNPSQPLDEFLSFLNNRFFSSITFPDGAEVDDLTTLNDGDVLYASGNADEPLLNPTSELQIKVICFSEFNLCFRQ